MSSECTLLAVTDHLQVRMGREGRWKHTPSFIMTHRTHHALDPTADLLSDARRSSPEAMTVLEYHRPPVSSAPRDAICWLGMAPTATATATAMPVARRSSLDDSLTSHHPRKIAWMTGMTTAAAPNDALHTQAR